jgi:hypothetical protein
MNHGASELMRGMLLGSAVLLATLLVFWVVGVALFRQTERERSRGEEK